MGHKEDHPKRDAQCDKNCTNKDMEVICNDGLETNIKRSHK
jgi:hypothetical protein